MDEVADRPPPRITVSGCWVGAFFFGGGVHVVGCRIWVSEIWVWVSAWWRGLSEMCISALEHSFYVLHRCALALFFAFWDTRMFYLAELESFVPLFFLVCVRKVPTYRIPLH